MTDPQTPTVSGARAWTTVECLALLALCWLALAGFSSQVDLHITDEVMYQCSGQDLLAGELSSRMLVWSPISILCYGLLDAVVPTAMRSGLFLQDGVAVLCSLGALTALWWALRGVLGTTAAFWAAAFWAASTPFVIHAERIHVYLFTAIFHFCAFGLVARRRLRFGLLLLGLAAINRGEQTPWFVAFAVVMAWRHSGRTRGFAIAAALFGASLFTLNSSMSEGRDRTWMAFSQHYAFGWAERHEAYDRPPMDYHAEITGKEFPTAHSVGSALLENPGEVLTHVWHNVALLPHAVEQAFLSPVAHVPWLRWIVVAAVGLLLVLGLLGRSKGHDERGGDDRSAADLRWLIWLALLCLPAQLLIRARSDLLLPILPLITIAAARTIANGWRRLSPPVATQVATRLPAILVLGVATLCPAKFSGDGVRFRPMRDAVPQVREFMREDRGLVATFSTQILGLAGVGGVGADLNSSFDPAKTRAGDLVLLTNADVRSHAEAFQRWFAIVTSKGWRLRSAGLGTWLFQRVD